jgi:isochorismate pyruvate lyase
METTECTTLDEARTKIDKVDEQIVALIAERNNYIIQSKRTGDLVRSLSKSH